MNFSSFDRFCMELALGAAWPYQLLTYPNPAVGAVVVKQQRILGIAAHQKAGMPHAEPLALLAAAQQLGAKPDRALSKDPFELDGWLRSLGGNFFEGCEIYVTLEPCSHVGKTPSCASLLKALAFKRVVVATKDPIKSHSGAIGSMRHIESGLMQAEAKALLEPFEIWQKESFVFVKNAQRLDGTIDGGRISSPDSQRHMHQLRALCDWVIVGGETVRSDRPTIDCRYSGDRAPDCFIYSRQKDFDSTIALFGVDDREVVIGSSLPDFSQPGLVMIEAGASMMEAVKEVAHWQLTYMGVGYNSEAQKGYRLPYNLRFLHHEQKGDDIMIWSRIDGY